MTHYENPAYPIEAEAGTAAEPAALAPDETPGAAAPGTFEPVALAARRDGWTPERQRAFIAALADGGLVCEAAARVGMSEQTARRLRRRPDAAGFSRAWDQAIAARAERSRSAWERAVNGTPRQRLYRGKVVGEDRVFDNRLLVHLLGRSAANRPAGGPGEARGTPAEDAEAKLAASREDRLAEEERQRDRYFARMASEARQGG
jgi:transposase